MEESIRVVAALVTIRNTVPHWESGISGSIFFIAEDLLWECTKDGVLSNTENGGEAYPYKGMHFASRKDIPEDFARAACEVCRDFFWEYCPRRKCKTLKKAILWAKVHNVKEPLIRPDYLDD